MKKYRIVIEGERDFTEEELLQFSNENRGENNNHKKYKIIHFLRLPSLSVMLPKAQ